MYPTLRSTHLLFGLFSVPLLLLYAISAVQMAHSGWFHIKPAVQEQSVRLSPGSNDSRQVSRELMTGHGLRGELTSVRAAPGRLTLRIGVPGKVHDVTYDTASGVATVKTSTSGLLGTMNRLHHAAGLWPAYLPLKLWGAFVLVVSLALIGLGSTGLWMWWMRRQERVAGLVLISANVIFSLIVLTMLRTAG